MQEQAVRAGVELVQYRCTIGHALGNHQRFVRPKVEAGVPGLVRHMDGFAADRVCSFFAQVIAACIQGRIVPVVGARNNIVAAGDPLRYRLGNAVGFLVNGRNAFFNGFEFPLCAVQVVGNGCGGFFQAADFRFDFIRRLGDQAFGAFLCYVVPLLAVHAVGALPYCSMGCNAMYLFVTEPDRRPKLTPVKIIVVLRRPCAIP